MQRTWRGFGDGESGTGDPGARLQAQDAANLAELVAASDARSAALQNVDPFTALQSRISASVPSAYRWPLILGGIGLLALVFLPGDGGRRRR